MTTRLTIPRIRRGLRRRAEVATAAVLTPFQRWSRARRFARLHRKYRAYTMVPARLWHDNLALCDRHARGPGCLVECGVWRGGMSAGMAEVLGPGRRSYLFDSFEGLPPADVEKDGARAVAYQADSTHSHYYNNCRAERAEAEAAMHLAGVTDAQLIQGWFKTTLPGFVPPEPIRVLRLDGDWYDSTKVCLEALYPHVAPGGLVLIDDYFAWDGCARAVHEYLGAQPGHQDRVRQTPRGVAYIVKGSVVPMAAP
jgi:O-methyltransferase